MRAKRFSPWLLEKENNQIGQEVEWQVVCSALGPPGATTTSYIRYGEGIDKYMELFNLAVDIGIISKGGAWYTFTSGKRLFQFMVEIFENNPTVYDNLVSEVSDALGI